VPSGFGKTTSRVIFEILSWRTRSDGPLSRPLVDIDELLCYPDYPENLVRPGDFLPPFGAWRRKDHDRISRLVERTLSTEHDADWSRVNRFWKEKISELIIWWRMFKLKHSTTTLSPVVLIHSTDQIPDKCLDDYLLVNPIYPASSDGVNYWRYNDFEIRYQDDTSEIRGDHRLTKSYSGASSGEGMRPFFKHWEFLHQCIVDFCLYPLDLDKPHHCYSMVLKRDPTVETPRSGIVSTSVRVTHPLVGSAEVQEALVANEMSEEDNGSPGHESGDFSAMSVNPIRATIRQMTNHLHVMDDLESRAPPLASEDLRKLRKSRAVFAFMAAKEVQPKKDTAQLAKLMKQMQAMDGGEAPRVTHDDGSPDRAAELFSTLDPSDMDPSTTKEIARLIIGSGSFK
jgi:hypothetical protein